MPTQGVKDGTSATLVRAAAALWWPPLVSSIHSQWSNSTEPAGAEVDSMCGGFREVGGLEPVKREYECLIAKRVRERHSNFAQE